MFRNMRITTNCNILQNPDISAMLFPGENMHAKHATHCFPKHVRGRNKPSETRSYISCNRWTTKHYSMYLETQKTATPDLPAQGLVVVLQCTLLLRLRSDINGTCCNSHTAANGKPKQQARKLKTNRSHGHLAKQRHRLVQPALRHADGGPVELPVVH